MASRCGHTKTTDGTSKKVYNTHAIVCCHDLCDYYLMYTKHFGTIICAVYVGIDCLTTSASLDVYLVLYFRLAGMAGLALLTVCLS